jgi:hypothetical protein
MYKSLAISSIITLVLSSCAQFVPPTGGKKDITPPKLIRSYPENKALNSQTNYIQLEFDEPIDINSLKQELSVSPELEGGYTVKSKLTSVELKLNQKLRDSTTYTFNFKNGVKDLNEKNPSKNLRLVFSTGNKIDSLGLTGKTVDLFTKSNINEVTVGLYDLTRPDTIPYYKRKPDYFVKTDSSGMYRFENIRNGRFRVLAFQDKNNNLIPEFNIEKAGFIKDTLQLKTQFENLSIELFTADFDTATIKKRTPRANTFILGLSKPIKDVKLLSKTDSVKYSFTSSEIIFYKDLKRQIDSLHVQFLVTDSTNRLSHLQEKIKFLTNLSTKKNNVEVTWTSKPENRKQVVDLNEIKIKTLVPIELIDTNKIIVRKDTINTIPFDLHKISDTEFVLKLNQSIIQKEKIEISLINGALTSVLGDTNTTKSAEILVLPKTETGQLTLVLDKECQTCFVELLDATNLSVIRKSKIKKKTIFTNLINGDYRFRIIEDINDNDFWDNGDLKNNILPEKVYFHPETIKIKTNFEIEQQIDNFLK